MEIDSLLDKFICENLENVVDFNLDEELTRVFELDEGIAYNPLKLEPKEVIVNYVWNDENGCLIKSEEAFIIEEIVDESIFYDQPMHNVSFEEAMRKVEDEFITEEVTFDTFDPREELFLSIITEEAEKISCPICNRIFTNSRYLIQHNRYKHSDKPFKCTKCRKTFPHENALENHLQKHQNLNKAFKCDVDGCQKAYTYKADLKIHHLNNHRKDMKSYVCEYGACGKKFSRSDHLNKHKKTHVRSMMKEINGGVKKRGMKRN